MNESSMMMDPGVLGSSEDHTSHPLELIEYAMNEGSDFMINCTALLFGNMTTGNISGQNMSSCLMPSMSPPPWWSQFLVQILYGLVCVIGLCGNTLVVYVVVRFSKMQTVTNLYIVNLAIADECFLVGIPFLMTTAILGYWPFGNIMCKAYFTSTSINQITSSMFLLIMSADRYLAVCHPITAARWRTPFIAKIVALTAWTLSALVMVPIFMYANTLEVDEKINCNIFWPNTEHWNGEAIFIVYSFILGFAVPITLISFFYVLVIRRLRTVGPKKRQNLGQSSNPKNEPYYEPTPHQTNRAKEKKKKGRKVTILVLTVITVYFLCWAPYWGTQMALIFMPKESHPSGAVVICFLLAGCLSYSNSAMNPILYVPFLSENFKKSFLKACTCAKGQKLFTFLLRRHDVESNSQYNVPSYTETVHLSSSGSFNSLSSLGQENQSRQPVPDDHSISLSLESIDSTGSTFLTEKKANEGNTLELAVYSLTQDVNATLHVENSVFPRSRRGSERQKGSADKGGGSATSGIGTGTEGAGGNGAKKNTLTGKLSTAGNIKGNRLQVPYQTSAPSPLSTSKLDIDSNEESEDEGLSGLDAKSRISGISYHPFVPDVKVMEPSSSADHDDKHFNPFGNDVTNPQETLVQDGVHVTSL